EVRFGRGRDARSGATRGRGRLIVVRSRAVLHRAGRIWRGGLVVLPSSRSPFPLPLSGVHVGIGWGGLGVLATFSSVLQAVLDHMGGFFRVGDPFEAFACF